MTIFFAIVPDSDDFCRNFTGEMMRDRYVALKIDVDTFAGTRDGVPNILEDLESFGVKGTFYFSMGPDNSGKAIRRIFTRPGFLKKMLRTNAPSVYGIRTMLYGTLLPPPMIASSFPEILRATELRGHEAGVHCWDHVEWHDHLQSFPKHRTALEIGQACSLFEDIMRHRPFSTAAPGWTVTADSLEIQDAMELSYCSDSRGESPFYPVVGGRPFKTLQIPTTLPTADEILGENGINSSNIHEFYLNSLKEGLNVITIHAELEGNAIRPSFVRMLKLFRNAGIRFVTLSEAASEASGALPCRLVTGTVPGRAGNMAIQGEIVG